MLRTGQTMNWWLLSLPATCLWRACPYPPRHGWPGQVNSTARPAHLKQQCLSDSGCANKGWMLQLARHGAVCNQHEVLHLQGGLQAQHQTPARARATLRGSLQTGQLRTEQSLRARARAQAHPGCLQTRRSQSCTLLGCLPHHCSLPDDAEIAGSLSAVCSQRRA